VGVAAVGADFEPDDRDVAATNAITATTVETRAKTIAPIAIAGHMRERGACGAECAA
jgi:hypothetical protein